MVFTNTDKALLMRAARHIAAAAETLKLSYGPNWGASAESRSVKREYDRLERDIRDLRVLAQRLEADARHASFLETETKPAPARIVPESPSEPVTGTHG